MRVTIFFSISFLMLSLIIPYNKKEATYIYLASGYTNDTVSLVVATFQVLKDEVVNTQKEHNDLTDIYVKLTKDSIICYKGSLIVSRSLMKRDDKSLKILLTINNHPYSYLMHLKQGRYLFITKHTYYYNVYFNQFKKLVTLY